MWKVILSTCNVIKRGIQWKLRMVNHIYVLFWIDNWCLPTNIIEYLKLDPYSIQNLHLTVYDCITPSKEWNVDFLRLLIPEHLVQIVFGIPIPK